VEINKRFFQSARSWRALMMAVFDLRQHFVVLQMDERTRLPRMFQPEIIKRLAANSDVHQDAMPLMKLYHPDSFATVIIVRSRCRGHAVDALHNLSAGGPVFQPIWIADLMQLNSLIGLRLIRDAAFAASFPIDVYTDAAFTLGRVVMGRSFSCSPHQAPTPGAVIDALPVASRPRAYAVARGAAEAFHEPLMRGYRAV
jgi:hypothetical protein